MHYKQLRSLVAQPRESGSDPGSFWKGISKTQTDGDNETLFLETCLQPSKSKVSRFS